MGRVCQICLHERANERFGGRGVRAKVCDACRQLPKIEQQQVLLTDEIVGYLSQSNISANNIARLRTIEGFEILEVAQQAAIVREIASVAPRKRYRWKTLRANHPDVFQLAIKVGLIDPMEDWPESFGASPFESRW